MTKKKEAIQVVAVEPKQKRIAAPVGPENILASGLGELKPHRHWGMLQTIGGLICLLGGAISWQFNFQGPAIALFIVGLIAGFNYLPVIVVRPDEYNDQTPDPALEKKA